MKRHTDTHAGIRTHANARTHTHTHSMKHKALPHVVMKWREISRRLATLWRAFLIPILRPTHFLFSQKKETNNKKTKQRHNPNKQVNNPPWEIPPPGQTPIYSTGGEQPQPLWILSACVPVDLSRAQHNTHIQGYSYPLSGVCVCLCVCVCVCV